jgi:hypothetical protein
MYQFSPLFSLDYSNTYYLNQFYASRACLNTVFSMVEKTIPLNKRSKCAYFSLSDAKILHWHEISVEMHRQYL